MCIGEALSSASDVDSAGGVADRRRRGATAAQTAARVREAQADAGGPRPGGEESAGGHHLTGGGGPVTVAPMSGACGSGGEAGAASELCAANAHRGHEAVAESPAGATANAVAKLWLCAETVSWASSRKTPPRKPPNR
jgi:hypothetical protein